MAQLLSLTGHGQPGPGKEAKSWQWRSQAIGIGRAPAVREPISPALARASRKIAWQYRDKQNALAGHVPGQAPPSLCHWVMVGVIQAHPNYVL